MQSIVSSHLTEALLILHLNRSNIGGRLFLQTQRLGVHLRAAQRTVRCNDGLGGSGRVAL